MSDDELLTTTISLWRVGVVMHIDGLQKSTLEEFFENILYAGASAEYVRTQMREFADYHNDSVELWADVREP